MPRRCPKRSSDVMTNPDSSAAIRSKDIDNSMSERSNKKKTCGRFFIQEQEEGYRTAVISERFEWRYKQLIDFIDEFGHCHVPWKFLADPSLWKWCGAMRAPTIRYNKDRRQRTSSLKIR